MKKFNLYSVGATLALTLGVAIPASAQLAYNFSDTGNCNFPPATCTVTGSATVANNLTLSGWGAASGANFVSATITDQTSSGIGMNADGSTAPNHAIDNNGRLELVMLNFGANKVVLTGLSAGWGHNDMDVAVLRWTGATGPDLTTTKVSDGATGLVAKGWAIVSSADLDSTATGGTGADITGTKSATTGLATTVANSSSWWIVSSYFGGGSLNGGTADGAFDYFKLLSVTAHCVGNATGGACNAPPPPGVPEPGSLALAGLALAGLTYGRRKSAK